MKKLLLCLVLMSAPGFSINLFAQKSDTLFYSVVKGGEKCGSQKSWMKGNAEYHFFFQFHDRGRGDSVFSQINTNDSGLIISAVTEGVDYYKNPYHESFYVKGDSAISRINGDSKQQAFTNEIYYSQEAPGSAEIVIKFLLQQKDMKAKVFLGGNLQLMPLHQKTLTFQGQPLHLSLCEVYLNENTPPLFFWLSADKHFFANVSDWFSTIRSGYEALADTLNTLQETQSKNYYGKQMQALAETEPLEFAVTHARLYDSQHASMLEDMTVIVSHGIIKQVTNSSSTKIPQGYKIIDGSDKTLLPGLWDMHAHYDKAEGLNYLAGGVTHVRDMGNSNRLPMIRDELARNELLGPDISYLSGFIDQAGPFQGPTGTIVHSLDEGLKAVDDYARRGYDQIKLYSSIDPKWVAPLCTEAHRLGLRVCGHIPSFMTASQAVLDGYNEITHMNMVMLNFMGDTIDTRARKRFTVVGERSKDLDLNSEEVNSFITLLKQKHISLDPTMNVFAGMFTVFPGDTDPSTKPIVPWYPLDQRGNLASQTSFAPVQEKSTYLASFNVMMQMLKKLYDNKILIVSGTDGGEAFALEHELELYVEAGIPPLNALQCATYNAALDCNLLDKYGTIDAGKRADMILVDGNPETNISDIRRVEWVIKNDRVYYSKKLFASIGWGYFN